MTTQPIRRSTNLSHLRFGRQQKNRDGILLSQLISEQIQTNKAQLLPEFLIYFRANKNI